MLFDIIKSEGSPLREYENLYTSCTEVEKCVRTNPTHAVLHSRVAAERFINIILEINGIEIPDDMDLRKQMGLESTRPKLIFCFEKGYITKNQALLLDKVRKAGNTVAMSGCDLEEANAIDAFDVFECLYKAISSYIQK